VASAPAPVEPQAALRPAPSSAPPPQQIPAAPIDPETEAARQKAGGYRSLGWGLLAVGGITAVVGAGYAASGAGNQSSVGGGGGSVPPVDTSSAPHTAIGLTAVGLGVAAAATGLVFVLANPDPEPRAALGVSPAGVLLSGRF
jgi:hypothetical protein